MAGLSYLVRRVGFGAVQRVPVLDRTYRHSPDAQLVSSAERQTAISPPVGYQHFFEH